MKIEQILRSLKKDYLKIEPPKELVEYGWWALSKEIDEQASPLPSKFTFAPIFARSIVFAAIALIVLVGASFTLVYASQKALPRDTLYPIKRFSEDVISAISGNIQVKIEKRAEEVVGAVNKKKDEEVIKEAIKEYKKAVSDTKKVVAEEDKESFKEKLKKQEELFEETAKESPVLKDELEEAIDASRKGREGNEIKDIQHQLP